MNKKAKKRILKLTIRGREYSYNHDVVLLVVAMAEIQAIRFAINNNSDDDLIEINYI